jgi:hypothetical protein
VVNAYQCLGIEACLVISDDALGNAFRAAGKLTHPDAGGEIGDFEAMRQAFEMLASPSKRLKHWLELQGITGQDRGSIDDGVMGLFAEVSEVTQRAESMVRKREDAKSALGRALLEPETQLCREQIERAISTVEKSVQEICATFPTLETDLEGRGDTAFRMVRNLAFLEKWRAGLRSCFARLI